VRLSDLVRVEGYGFMVDTEPWLQPDVQGDPKDVETFTALAGRRGEFRYIVCIEDSLDHVYSCAHEIAGDRWGHEHTEMLWTEQANILAGWVKLTNEENDDE
jgi:hypothetical protein